MSDETTVMTTGETTSHPTKQPENSCQVVGYSHLTDKTTSHSTRLSKDDNQVTGYNPASEKLLAGHPKDAGQVIDEATSHLTKAASGQVIGYDIRRHAVTAGRGASA